MADDVTSAPSPAPATEAGAVTTDTTTPVTIPQSTPAENKSTTPASKNPPQTTESKTSEKENTTPKSSASKTTGLKEAFKAFSKFGDTKSDGKLITLSQSDKWMKQAKVIDGKKITTTDTGIYFKKFKSLKISFEDYKKFLDELAKSKSLKVEDIQNKLAACGPPALHGVGSSKADSTVERLTDVTKYTGSHKQRFDETGKGKGIAGRKDITDSSGYVQGYQNKNTYSKSH